jgi:aspartokinase/homoserine dehydrogenase 1
MCCAGFVAETQDGIPCTLKRNGSDYTATIVGNLLTAEKINVWTDVDGVYSADPRKVHPLWDVKVEMDSFVTSSPFI